MIKNIILLGCTGLVCTALAEIFLFIAPQHQAGEPIAALMFCEGEGRHAKRQREIIERTASAEEHVHGLDLKGIIEAEGHDGLYGDVDKHFNERGYFLAAKAIHGWINDTWRSNVVDAPVMAETRPQPLRPDCAVVPDYIETFSSPEGAALERVSSLEPVSGGLSALALAHP